MLLVNRRQKIKDIILEKKSITVAELATKFHVTEETIRRDLTALEKEGFLTRTHGGAFIQGGVQNDVLSSLRENAFIDSKKTIAKRVSVLINNGDSIFLDHATTCTFIAEAVKSMRLTVITNNLKVVNLLSNFSNINLIVAGGTYSDRSQAFLGTSALDFLEPYYVDKAFVSCRTISTMNGVTDSTQPSADLRKKIISHSNLSFLVLDYSKFNNASFIKICNISEFDGVITDKTVTDKWKKIFLKNNVQIFDSN